MVVLDFFAHFTPFRPHSPARAVPLFACTVVLLLTAIWPLFVRAAEYQPPATPSPVAVAQAQPQPTEGPAGHITEVVSIAVTAVGTLVIAWFTASMALSTKRLWEEAKASGATANATAEAAKANADAAKANAEAARDSVEALRAAERSYVFAEVVPDVWGRSPGASSGWINATVRFWNHGKTPAVILLIRASMRVGGGNPTGLIEFPGSDSRLPEGLAIPSAERYEVPVQQLIDNIPDVEGLNVIVYCVGKIEYADVLGKEHATTFCWHYIPQKHKWELARESPLNERT